MTTQPSSHIRTPAARICHPGTKTTGHDPAMSGNATINSTMNNGTQPPFLYPNRGPWTSSIKCARTAPNCTRSTLCARNSTFTEPASHQSKIFHCRSPGRNAIEVSSSSLLSSERVRSVQHQHN